MPQKGSLPQVFQHTCSGKLSSSACTRQILLMGKHWWSSSPPVCVFYFSTWQRMCFCEPAPALLQRCWWTRLWWWRPAEDKSAAWAAGTPRRAPPAGWCHACQPSSSVCTRTPALKWPVSIERDCLILQIKSYSLMEQEAHCFSLANAGSIRVSPAWAASCCLCKQAQAVKTNCLFNIR